MIYLDSAATCYQRPVCVKEAIVEALDSFGNPGRGANEASLCASRAIYRTRKEIAELFGASSAERVVFTANATEALNFVIRGLSGKGVHAFTTCMDHNSVLRPLTHNLGEDGFTVTGLKNDGTPDYEALESELQKYSLLRQIADKQSGRRSAPGPEHQSVFQSTDFKVGRNFVICTHASNLTGDMTDISRVGALAHKYGAWFIVDASQTAGVFPINMSEDHIDALCFTGHKSLFGPQGTGGLVLSENFTIPASLSGGTGTETFNLMQPEKLPEHLEAGTLNAHGLAGLLAGVSWVRKRGLESIYKKESSLANDFYLSVKDIPGVRVYGNFGTRKRAPIVTLNIRDFDSGVVEDILSCRYKIAVRSGGHCAPLMHLALGTKNQGAIRFSFSVFNTDSEIKTAAQAVREIADEH